MERSMTDRPGLGNAGREGGAGEAVPSVPLQQAAFVIAGAVAVALVVWGLVRLVGVDPVVGRGGDTTSVTLVDVVVATGVAGLAAWGVQAILRRSGRVRWWPFVGSTALSISVIGPSWLADGASGIALILMHIAVGAVLIAGFHRAPWVKGSALHRPPGDEFRG
jgi:hypothetical protein